MITRGSAVPPWRQLARLLRERIESGELAPGMRLPSIVSLSQEYDLAPLTVRKALRQLKDEGLIVIEPGWGSFVAERESGG